MARIKGNNNPNTLTGTKNNDEMYGYGGDDQISGLGGNDYIDGGDGNDWLSGGIGSDTLRGGLGNDQLDGGDGNDNLHGDMGVANEFAGGSDELRGGAGNDVLVGQYGADFLWGGIGADQFGYNQATDSRADTGIDRIYDFNPGEGDTIYLSNAVDADPQISGRQNYLYVATRSSGQENVGTLTAFDSDGDGINDSTRVDLYQDSDDIADLTIELIGYLAVGDPIAGMVDFFG